MRVSVSPRRLKALRKSSLGHHAPCMRAATCHRAAMLSVTGVGRYVASALTLAAESAVAAFILVSADQNGNMGWRRVATRPSRRRNVRCYIPRHNIPRTLPAPTRLIMLVSPRGTIHVTGIPRVTAAGRPMNDAKRWEAPWINIRGGCDSHQEGSQLVRIAGNGCQCADGYLLQLRRIDAARRRDRSTSRRLGHRIVRRKRLSHFPRPKAKRSF